MLKRFILAIAIFLAVTQARATITISIKPEKVTVGEMLVIPVTGAAPEWFHEFEVSCFPYEGSQCFKSLTMPEELGDPGTPQITVRMTRPGTYRIAVATRDVDGSLDVAEAIVTVTGEGPAPDPFPEPRPEPIPVGELSIVVISETQTRTAKEAAALGKLRSYWESNPQEYFRQIVDPDIVSGSTNRTPEWLLPYLEAVTTRPVTLPVIAFGRTSPSGRFSVLAVEALPDDGDAAVELVKKYEARP